MQKGKYTVKTHVTPLVDIERLHQPTNLKNRSTINDIALFPWVYNALIWFMSWYNYASLCHYPYVKYKSFGRYTFSASASNFNIHKLSIIPTGGNKKKRELGFANRRGNKADGKAGISVLGKIKEEERKWVWPGVAHWWAGGHCSTRKTPSSRPSGHGDARWLFFFKFLD